jgi:hypothetical protein
MPLPSSRIILIPLCCLLLLVFSPNAHSESVTVIRNASLAVRVIDGPLSYPDPYHYYGGRGMIVTVLETKVNKDGSGTYTGDLTGCTRIYYTAIGTKEVKTRRYDWKFTHILRPVGFYYPAVFCDYDQTFYEGGKTWVSYLAEFAIRPSPNQNQRISGKNPIFIPIFQD